MALANEVVWSRMLLLYQGTSIYSFSSMLAVVLGGMGVGSYLGGQFLTRLRNPLRQLARVQLGIGLAGVFALHLFPYLTAGLFWPAVELLAPLGVLWGLAFALGAACYPCSQNSGRTIAELYAWNTFGCIAGSLAAGFVLIPLLGTALTAASLAGISLFLGVLLLWVHPEGGFRQARWLEWGLAGACLVLLATLGDPYFKVLEPRMRDCFLTGLEVLRHTEDATATTTVFQMVPHYPRQKHLWINGEGMTCLAPVTKLMGHLPVALADNPQEALVICFGMGTTLRSISRHEGMRVRAVELVPAVLSSFGFFHPDGPEILKQPNVQTAADDGRNYLLMHPQQYDVLTLDPPPPLDSAGCVNLYSREFFALCRQRLRPWGRVLSVGPSGSSVRGQDDHPDLPGRVSSRAGLVGSHPP